MLESKAETDYVPNINSFVAEKCDMIITVGFLLGDATKAAAEANPDIKFSIVDYAYDPAIPNVLGQVYATDEAAFLAGYLAAGVSKTGIVGTFGGINIPPVTDLHERHRARHRILQQAEGREREAARLGPARKACSPATSTRSSDGRDFAKNLNDEGADIVMPVAGPVGQGSAALATELGADKLKIIGVDVDQYLTDPDHKAVFLTSVLKRMDSTTVAAIKQGVDGSFKGGVIVGNLASGGVGLAPYHDLDSAVPADLKARARQDRRRHQGRLDQGRRLDVS